MEDGTAMRFADEAVEVPELFRSRTYDGLVAALGQDSVAWGGWHLNRSKTPEDNSQFSIERSLGERATAYVRTMGAAETSEGVADSQDTEMGFQYRLQSKDFLKVGFRDEEEFVGVEHKSKF